MAERFATTKILEQGDSMLLTILTMNNTPKRPRDLGSALAAMDLDTSTTTSNKENLSVDNLIADIHSVLTTKQRFAVLNRLYKALKQPCSSGRIYVSQDQSSRSADAASLIKAGIINALALQLHHLIHTHGSTIAEVELICHCFALLLASQRSRSRHDHLERLFLEQGAEFVDLLTASASMAARKRQHKASKSNIQPIQQSVVQIFYMISSYGSGAVLLLRCQSAVESIIGCIASQQTPNDAITEALGIWKNLTYFEEDCRKFLMMKSGFLDTLTALPGKSISLKARQRLSGILRNLVISVECRSILAGHASVYGAIAQLMTWEPLESLSSAQLKEYSNMRRNLLNVLISLSMDHNSALLLIFHGDGLFLSILKRYLIDQTDSTVRKRSACLLRLLANKTSAPLLIHDADLMHVLSDSALRDDSVEVRREASEAFARCAALVQADRQPHYHAILEALTELVRQPHRPKSISLDVIARALKEQSLHMGNRRPMAERGILLTTLSQIALSRDPTLVTAVHDACCALEQLSKEPLNLWRLAKQPCILDALLANAISLPGTTRSHGESEDRPCASTFELNCAVRTLMNLTVTSVNRKIMTKHTCLLQTMILALRSVPREQTSLKGKVRETVMVLAKEL
jgi:hypothetical protein